MPSLNKILDRVFPPIVELTFIHVSDMEGPYPVSTSRHLLDAIYY